MVVTHGAFCNPLVWSRYRGANPLPNKLLADCLATPPSKQNHLWLMLNQDLSLSADLHFLQFNQYGIHIC